MDHFRLALVGLGRAGQFHLQSIRQLAELELGYVIDADQGLAEQTPRPMAARVQTTSLWL